MFKRVRQLRIRHSKKTLIELEIKIINTAMPHLQVLMFDQMIGLDDASVDLIAIHLTNLSKLPLQIRIAQHQAVSFSL